MPTIQTFNATEQAGFSNTTKNTANALTSNTSSTALSLTVPQTWTSTGSEVLLLINTAAAAATVTLVSARGLTDGRTRTYTYALAANEVKIIGRFKRRNFSDALGEIGITASAVTVRAAIYRARIG